MCSISKKQYLSSVDDVVSQFSFLRLNFLDVFHALFIRAIQKNSNFCIDVIVQEKNLAVID